MSDDSKVEPVPIEEQLGECERRYVESMKTVTDAKETLSSAQTRCFECLQQMNQLQRQYLLAANQQLARSNAELNNQVKVLTTKASDEAVAELRASSPTKVKFAEAEEREANLVQPV
jgi:chromosome segregation ATPase